MTAAPATTLKAITGETQRKCFPAEPRNVRTGNKLLFEVLHLAMVCYVAIDKRNQKEWAQACVRVSSSSASSSPGPPSPRPLCPVSLSLTLKLFHLRQAIRQIIEQVALAIDFTPGELAPWPAERSQLLTAYSEALGWGEAVGFPSVMH